MSDRFRVTPLGVIYVGRKTSPEFSITVPNADINHAWRRERLYVMYYWRKLPDDERVKVLKERKARKVAWQAPPHLEYEGNVRFIVTATCYEHKHIIGKSPE